ncbi:MAG TPA: chalcone isomerase family protein [Kiritimatiellia bacterium]|nr:chalcone isomerase family protein [Kiritimatiellia bacterium]
MKLLFVSVMLTSIALMPTPSLADRYARMFPENVDINGAELVRNGVSKLTVRLVFDVYVAAFYQEPGRGPNDVTGDYPKHLEIEYLRSISSRAFIDAGNDMLIAQHDKQTIASIQSRIDTINQWYQDVKKGDRYSLTYIPGIGTELKFNGESKGIIPGEDFARIYLTIWLGENNPYKSFRDRLVGIP